MALARVLWRDEWLASVPVRRAFALKTGEGLRADDCLLMRRILLDLASSVTRTENLVTDEARSRSILRISKQSSARKPSPVFRANARRTGTDASHSSRHSTRANAIKQAAALRRTKFEEMFVVSHRGFLAIARMILRNREDAEDAVHNAFLSGSLNLHRFEERSALKTWFT